MTKLLHASLLSVIGALAIAGNAIAACSDGAMEKTWDKTASGYCKIFFPDCTKDSIGKRLSYSREYAGSEILCTGENGRYDAYYKTSIRDADAVFKTDFAKMGVNYASELSEWLFENCQKHCDDTADVKAAARVSQYDLKKADDAARAAEAKAEISGAE
jgi:hypothetical protein